MDQMQNKSGAVDEEDVQDFEEQMLNQHAKKAKMQRSPRQQISYVYVKEMPDAQSPAKEQEMKEKRDRELRILKQKQEQEQEKSKNKDVLQVFL